MSSSSESKSQPLEATTTTAAADRKERVAHESDWLIKAIQAYCAPLHKHYPSGIPCDMIVFRCGTFVQLDCKVHAALDAERGFKDDTLDEYLYTDFPGHRFVDKTYEDASVANQVDFEWSQTTAYPEACRKAYGCLMWSGYPLPGGIGGDRDITTWSPEVFLTIFRALGLCCWTIHHCPGEPIQQLQQADRAEFRRLDYMFPKPFAYIGKDLVVHIL